METEKLDELIAKLKANGQLILTGAPGTGKTHTAQEIAAKMLGTTYDELMVSVRAVSLKIEDEKQKSLASRYAFVQFHPGYDYSDFVEGLKPKPIKKGVVFVRTPGVFKKFCDRLAEIENSASTSSSSVSMNNNSVTNDNVSSEDKFESAYRVLIEKVKNAPSGVFYVQKKKGTKAPVKFWNPNKPEMGFSVDMHKRWGGVALYADLRKTFLKLKTKKVFDRTLQENIRKMIDKGKRNPSGFCAVLGELFSIAFPLEPVIESQGNNIGVFIIDEINRADLSRVFGELFSGLEMEYRGTPIKTQYSYFDEDKNHDFIIPPNAYIIGTMNDIDRNVESMDFALRRRFAWHEITAHDSLDILKYCIEDDAVREKAQNAMTAINQYIGPWGEKDEPELLGTDGISLNLGKDYQLGGAYFKKITKYMSDGVPDWDALWENHLEVILCEYLRSKKDAKKILKALKDEYDKAVGPSDNTPEQAGGSPA